MPNQSLTPDAGTPSPAVSVAPSSGDASDPDRAAVAPSPAPVSAAEHALPGHPADSAEEAKGRRTLSTAFVMVGPDGRLTVEMTDGRVLVLKDVIMRPKDFCGSQIVGGKAGAQFCAGYAGVAAARPGGA